MTECCPTRQPNGQSSSDPSVCLTTPDDWQVRQSGRSPCRMGRYSEARPLAYLPTVFYLQARSVSPSFPLTQTHIAQQYNAMIREPRACCTRLRALRLEGKTSESLDTTFAAKYPICARFVCLRPSRPSSRAGWRAVPCRMPRTIAATSSHPVACPEALRSVSGCRASSARRLL